MFLKTFIIVAVLLLSATIINAHTALCSCFYNGDNTITCEGGFSDGSSAAGVIMRIETTDGTVLYSGQMDADAEFTFDKPDGYFIVVFDAGEGHRVHIRGEDIF